MNIKVFRSELLYKPTEWLDVQFGMAAFEEETFGPVAAVEQAHDTDHALVLANECSFGLGASIWTKDTGRGEALAGEIEAGVVFVNEIVKSNPRLPFGGIKRSGFGCELSECCILELVNAETV